MAGTDKVDQKIVLLHELAHWVNPQVAAHTAQFWDLAWVLFRQYRLPVQRTLVREGNYRRGALAAARRAGIAVEAAVSVSSKPNGYTRHLSQRWAGERFFLANHRTIIVDRKQGGIDGDCRYAVVCLEHSALIDAGTLRLAWVWARHPTEWCDACDHRNTPSAGSSGSSDPLVSPEDGR